MRELSFSVKWDKLRNQRFTTFRFPRKGRDWGIGEEVRVIYKGRTHDKEVLGKAIILERTSMHFWDVTDEEARMDGFPGLNEMKAWFRETYGARDVWFAVMNKLTLVWTM